jgi:hypothetical protein
MAWTDLRVANEKRIGSLPLTDLQPVALDFSSDVPKEAKQILVHVRAYSGSAGHNGQRTFSIWTQADTGPCRVRFYMFGYPQNAISFNSSNFWLPIPTDIGDRKLYIQQDVGAVDIQNCGSDVIVLAYQ